MGSLVGKISASSNLGRVTRVRSWIHRCVDGRESTEYCPHIGWNLSMRRMTVFAIRRTKRPDNRFFRSNEQSSVRTLREKGVADGS
jgi:hypothetical protein